MGLKDIQSFIYYLLYIQLFPVLLVETRALLLLSALNKPKTVYREML